MKKYSVVSFSGGKDSTAMLLKMLELNIPIDEIRYFDCGSWEFPQMKKHIDKVENYINRPINRMKYKYSFDFLFSEKVTKRGFKGYGFPTMVYRWCTGIKMNTLKKGLNKKETILYLGFTIDELQRAKPINARGLDSIFPLIEWGWDEQDCLDYCYSRGFDWDGLYEYFDRVSCWCCPFQKLQGLRNLRKYFPNLWRKLLDMQKETISKHEGKISDMAISFRMDGTTVFDLEERFKKEDMQGKLFR